MIADLKPHRQIHKQPIHIRRPLILITLLSSPSPANCLLLTANFLPLHSALLSHP